jgi:hypothetical protein
MVLAYINYRAGRMEEFVLLLEKVRSENRDNIPARVALAAFYQHEGEQERARMIAREILEINPAMTAERGTRLISVLGKITPKRQFGSCADDLVAAGLPRIHSLSLQLPEFAVTPDARKGRWIVAQVRSPRYTSAWSR